MIFQKNILETRNQTSILKLSHYWCSEIICWTFHGCRAVTAGMQRWVQIKLQMRSYLQLPYKTVFGGMKVIHLLLKQHVVETVSLLPTKLQEKKGRIGQIKKPKSEQKEKNLKVFKQKPFYIPHPAETPLSHTCRAFYD